MSSVSVSSVDICNIALAHLGDQEITRLDEEAAEENPLVRYCRQYYETARQTALETFEWSFAMKSQELSRRTNVATPGFLYAQVLPEDCLKLLTLHEGTLDNTTGIYSFHSEKMDYFRIVGLDVWTNIQTVSAFYTADVTDPTMWSGHFRFAVARLLASLLAGPLTDNPGEATRQKEIYETVDLPNAQYYDAVQDRSGENSNMVSVRARDAFLNSHRTGSATSGYYADGTPID
jgi:hypothetical protein